MLSGGGLGEAERLALVSAPASLRSAWRVVLELDAQLARIALHAREPALTQLKLAWWRDACSHPGEHRGQPVLQDLARSPWAEPESLVELVNAWEEVAVGEGAYTDRVERLARVRVEIITRATEIPPAPGILEASRCWTLAVLADHAPRAEERVALLTTIRALRSRRLSRALRPLAVLAGLARRAARRGGGALLGDRLSPLAAVRLGIFGR